MGVPTRVQKEAYSNIRALSKDSLQRPRETNSNQNRGSVNAGETGYRGSEGRSWSRLLLQTLSSQEKERKVASCNQPQEAQQVPTDSQIPHGNDTNSMGQPQSRQLHLFPGLTGRILSRTYSPEIPQVPEICIRGQGLSVQSPAFRFVYQPLDVHQDGLRGQKDGPSYADHALCLSIGWSR